MTNQLASLAQGDYFYLDPFWSVNLSTYIIESPPPSRVAVKATLCRLISRLHEAARNAIRYRLGQPNRAIPPPQAVNPLLHSKKSMKYLRKNSNKQHVRADRSYTLIHWIMKSLLINCCTKPYEINKRFASHNKHLRWNKFIWRMWNWKQKGS